MLNIGKNASSSEIKKSYIQLAKKFHPDTSKEPDAKNKFVEVQEAYEVRMKALPWGTFKLIQP